MALFPFSIADIDDPSHIRVVLYASGRMGHAPLNALLKQILQEGKREDKNTKKLYTTFTAYYGFGRTIDNRNKRS
uniref:Uncharacterized protein n=1 Tax=Bartonella rochalimae ATCC BAA-1498 TaxID=685782 RepID=E6YN66_9HYPH|nr:hypothetical protein BARRO_120078 [Bartonella rochalimae ATCC BAA-1498]